MLKNITINNFAIIDNLELDFKPGMTVLTGETGAGKSIVIDALQYALGARADSSMVRHACARADIHVEFNIQNIPNALLWLKEHLFDEQDECLLRRTINADGGSKQFVNGQPCTQNQMRDLAGLLISIHGQHDNHLLGQKQKQQQLLDEFAVSLTLRDKKNQGKALDNFAQHGQLLEEVQLAYKNWAATKTKITDLERNVQDYSAKIDLLNYQIQELENLDLRADELKKIEQEHKLLINSEDLARDCAYAKSSLNNESEANVILLLQNCVSRLQIHQHLHPSIANSFKLLDEALIQIEEAHNDLESYLANIEVNPERLHFVETRLERLYDLARKHKIQPELLPEKLSQLKQELHTIQHADKELQKLAIELKKYEQAYQIAAMKLSQSRISAAKILSEKVSENLQLLGMLGGKFDVSINHREDLNPQGNEQIEFLVSANPGQPLKPISKVASGGELSRISLAIEVITAQNTNTPTLIFDEVDVGIGGATAEIVGKLLRQLGTKTQVLCITHLAQVAAQAQHHLQVSKITDGSQTQTQIQLLTAEQKIHEIARMLGGLKISAQSLAHAKELLIEPDN